MVDVPVVSAMQVPRVCAVKKTAETQLPLVKKIGVIPETIEIQLGINSESSVGRADRRRKDGRGGEEKR